jgi:hypothetical protein
MTHLIAALGQAIVVLTGLCCIGALVMVLTKEAIWIRTHFWDGVPPRDDSPNGSAEAVEPPPGTEFELPQEPGRIEGVRRW